MKKRICLIAIASLSLGLFVAPNIEAQTTKSVTKTVTGVDTVTFTNVPSKLRSLQYTYTKTSGTAAGIVVLEASTNGTWFSLDTLTLANVTTAQTMKYTFTTGTSYLSYRWRNTNTSAAPGIVKAAYLRRSDD